MITGDIKNKIDKIWDTFFVAGITNPITVLEQMTYIFFMKMLDDKRVQKFRTRLFRLDNFGLTQKLSVKRKKLAFLTRTCGGMCLRTSALTTCSRLYVKAYSSSSSILVQVKRVLTVDI